MTKGDNRHDFLNATGKKRATLTNRRDILRLGTAVFAGLSLNRYSDLISSSVHADSQNRRSAEHPNILLIITDQQHAGMMSCAGNRWLKTPAMDALAARGVRFERAYCSNPVCVPSRFSMMTGVLPSRIGMDRNKPASFPVTDEILQYSLGHVFLKAGYKTVYGGKVHLPGTKGKGIAAYGFDTLTGDQREGLAEACAKFIKQKHRQPFLLVASFINPHDICYMAIDAFTQAKGGAPMYPNSSRERECLAEALRLPAGMSRDEFFAKLCPPLPSNFEIPKDEPPAVRDTDWREFRQYVQKNWSRKDWQMHRWAYARLTERVDSHIGKVLDALRTNGLEDNTVVFFTSDHGDMDSAHRLEHKSMPYEEAARVPLIVSQPGVTAEGLVDRINLVSTGLDLIPTLCEFAGIQIPASLAGHSVKPLTISANKRHRWRDNLVFENEGSRVLVSERNKYAVYNHGEPLEMLFDLESDPGEMNNLAVDHRYMNILNQHRRLLCKWYDENGETLDEKYIVAS
ncbi:MAG: sulfatase family protein [Planctomycetota bacterium]|jgi:choline-sulfatase